MSRENKNSLSAGYQAALLEQYDPLIVGQMLPENWRYADILDQPGEKIAYIRLNQGEGERPVLFIPGFTEGIVSKAPFAADLAQRDFDVILPDQNRGKLRNDPLMLEQAATYSQALNYLAIISAEGLEQVDVVTHSYGSLIFDSMVRVAERQGQHYFDGSKVVMLTPSGFSDETPLSLGSRFARELRFERKPHQRSFPDQSEMLTAGIGNLKSNIHRSIGEVMAILKRKVDYPLLLKRLGDLTILSYADDKLYSEDLLRPSRQTAFANEAAVGWAVPITLFEKPEGHKPDATHNDEQFNPSRVAASVAQILQG